MISTPASLCISNKERVLALSLLKMPVAPSHPDSTRFKQPEILIVDDDPDIQTVLHDLLESEGYIVTQASTCREALRRTRTTPFDVVLLDIGLPDGDGFSVLGQLQEMTPSLPVILLTAATSTDLHAVALNRGAFSFLAKPYNHHELRLLVRHAVATTDKVIHRDTGSSRSHRSDAVQIVNGHGMPRAATKPPTVHCEAGRTEPATSVSGGNRTRRA
jgi:DNA-binding response OmpR family regulator